MNQIDVSLIDWSRAQFALTAIYHWCFVPLTLGLGVIMAVMESIYYRTGKEKWKRTAKFWMKLFGVNFAIGVATGIILEFEFGTNWSNYSWFVGDIFGAPLAIEGIVAFFMEATFIAVMFFGWKKVSKGFHLASTWLTVAGATISALWILVANAWMQNPVGMTFNPETVRNEMTDFWALISPFAIDKFCHTVISSWLVGSAFVVGVSSYFLLKKKETEFALDSVKIATIIGAVGIILSIITGDSSGHQVAQKQPMKLAAMEGLYDGEKGAGLTAIGIVNPSKQPNDAEEAFIVDLKIPKMLSFLANRDFNSFVPGVNDLINGYTKDDGTQEISVDEKIEKGKQAIAALADYSAAKKAKDETAKAEAKQRLDENFKYFGYGYFSRSEDVVPNVPLVFYAFRIMVCLAGYFLLLFVLVWFFNQRKKFAAMTWLQWVCILSIPLAYLTSQAGWIVAEVGRQPWTIQDILPVQAAVSDISASNVQLTFIIFAVLLTVLFVAEISIMIKQIKLGPEVEKETEE
ncbi:MAG: cytochrome ubiquinol oxidase subunit I [Bacteroidales bacterium]|jgi:cytochrome d ubiquinol oxidase subunit I|nr:cytochrome ubiquinol oxidase subunit I [Bacteroidales bacterium]